MGTSSFQLADRVVDLSAARVLAAGSEQPLSPIEVKLLAYLADRPDQLVGRDELLQRVWGYRDGIRSRTIDNTVRRLRLKIEPDPSEPKHLHVVYGQGLRLTGLLPSRAERLSNAGLFGRQRELAALRQAIDQGEKRVTLSGPPGIGKTRLARTFYDELTRLSPERALFAWVGSLDPDTAVADVLGIAGAGPVDRIVPDALSSRGAIVLVLDECEHKSEAVAAAIERWERKAPAMQIIATSRAPLLARGLTIALSDLDEADATALFLARMSSASPEPRPVRDPEIIRRFARAVECNPLALELGAIRAAALGVESLGAAPASAAEIVQRSISDLRPEHRVLLSALSIFEAPFSLEDAAHAAAVSPTEAADGLLVLVRRNLARICASDHEGTAPVRYTLFALVRESVRSAMSPETRAIVRSRWAERLARLGDYLTCDRARSDATLRRVYRAMLPELLAICDDPSGLPSETVVLCGIALVTQLGREGPMSDARDRISALLHRDCSDRSRALLGRAESILAAIFNDPQWGMDAVERALPYAKEPDITVELRSTRAARLLEEGDRPAAQRELDACRELLSRAGPAAARYHDAASMMAEDYDRAQEETLAAARVARRYGDHITEGKSLAIAGHNAAFQGAWALAKSYLDRAMTALQAVGLPSRSIWLTSHMLGQFERHKGRLDRAESVLREALAYGDHLGDKTSAAITLTELALVSIARGDTTAAEPMLDRALVSAGDPPNQSALLVWSAIAEAALVDHKLSRAREALSEAQNNARSATSIASLRGMLAVTEAWSGDLDAAKAILAELDPGALTGPHRVRYLAMAGLVDSLAGDLPSADARIAEARALLAPLEPGPQSHLAQWLARAERSRSEAGAISGRIYSA